MRQNRSIISGLDWWTILLFFVIALFGWLNIYGSSYSFDQTSIWDFSNRAGKQLVWIATAVVLGTIILMIEEKAYDVLGYVFYGAMILLLIITPIFARDIKGSLSWLTIGPISLQPAEFAKCFTAIAIAKFMSRFARFDHTICPDWSSNTYHYDRPTRNRFCIGIFVFSVSVLSSRNDRLCIGMGRGKYCAIYIGDSIW